MPTPFFSLITDGLFFSPNFGSILSRGLPIRLNSSSKINPEEDPSRPGLTPNLNLSPKQLADLQSFAVLKNPDGSIIVPTQTGFMEMGEGYSMNFDPDTLRGRIIPSLEAIAGGLLGNYDLFGLATETYTGSDVRIMIESAEPVLGGRRYAKQLLEATTISVSVHREVAPVRASGYINPKGFALGKRTIAGTLIITQFTVDALMKFLQSIMLTDGSKDSTFTKVDQLPPFNMTLIFTNEAGYASHRRLLGVKFVTDGVVYSIQDMLVEQTISWIATDFTPLLPFFIDNLFQPISLLDKTTRREKTPLDVMLQGI